MKRLDVEPRSLHDFAIWRAELKTVENLGASTEFIRNLSTEDGRVEPVHGTELTANSFRLMGTAPLLGRTLVDRDENPAEPLVTVIGELIWKTRFDSDPAAVRAAMLAAPRSYFVASTSATGMEKFDALRLPFEAREIASYPHSVVFELRR